MNRLGYKKNRKNPIPSTGLEPKNDIVIVRHYSLSAVGPIRC